MDRSSLIVVVMPITTMVALFTGIVVPFIAARRPGGRKTRPPEPGADDTTPAGYLYVPCARHPRDAYPAQGRRWVQEVPIVKRTAKLIYYTSDSWDRREAVVSPGCISREQFETDTRCHDHCPRDIAVGLVCAPTGAATATACMCWPRAVTATRLEAADNTARQILAACGAHGTGTRGSTASTGKTGAVTDTRPG